MDSLIEEQIMPDDERALIGISKIARQKVIDRLKYSYAHDHLDEYDFEKRMDLATNTRNKEILKELVEDLPEANEDQNVYSRQADENAFNVYKGAVKPSDTIVSFFSGVSRKGQWHPARKMKIVAIMGGVELDFSNALMPPGTIEIDVFCLMGGIEMRVPEGVNVDAHPVAIMGGVENHGFGHYGPNAPTIKLRGFIMMGGVEVKPPKKNTFRKFIKNMFLDE
jgi:hypothetical protein